MLGTYCSPLQIEVSLSDVIAYTFKDIVRLVEKGRTPYYYSKAPGKHLDPVLSVQLLSNVARYFS